MITLVGETLSGEIIRRAKLFEVVSLMNLHETRKELVNFIVQKVEIKQILKITPSMHHFLLHLNFPKLYGLL